MGRIIIHDEREVDDLRRRKYDLEEKQAMWNKIDALIEENKKLKRELKKKNTIIKKVINNDNSNKCSEW